MTEQITPLFKWMKEHFANTMGSEYLGSGFDAGAIVDGVRHEDVQELSFDDGQFDLVFSFEVLEHVPFERRAFSELARCIKPSGRLLLTVPFRSDRESHEVRAIQRPDSTIEHLLTPEYHGNPVDPGKGSLCFRNYGWRLLSDLCDAGFRDAEALFYWSRRFGYLGDGCIIIAER